MIRMILIRCDFVFVLVHPDWIYDPETPNVRVPLPLRAVPL